jgi:hypothetical protein
MLTMMFLLAMGLASAATVDLNNGSSVQGDIIKQDNKSIQINVDGVTMTYYADEIKDIDGKPFTPAPAAQPDTIGTGPQEVTQPDAAAPAAQPEAVAPAPAAQPVSVSETGTIDPDKKALILKFIDVFGTRQALTNNFNMMLKQIEKDKPDEAQKIRQRVKVDEIIDRLLPIYDRNFSTDDLNSFIAFYGSSEGQKLIGTIPELMKESVQESIKYMEEKFPEVRQGQQH